MTTFVLKNTYFEFNVDIKKHTSRTVTGTKISPPYARMFMDDFENVILESQNLQPLVWCMFMDGFKNRAHR